MNSRLSINRNRSITRTDWKQSEEGSEQWLRALLLFLHSPSFFRGHKDRGSGQTCCQRLLAAPRPACPLSPLPMRIPQNSCNLGHRSFCKTFTRNSSNSLYNMLHSQGNLGTQNVMTQGHLRHWDQELANFSVKDQIVNILSFVGREEKSKILHRH